jgi:hypothetical protein
MGKNPWKLAQFDDLSLFFSGISIQSWMVLHAFMIIFRKILVKHQKSSGSSLSRVNPMGDHN